MISYCILAFFATLYFLVLLTDVLMRARKTTGKPRNGLAFFISGFRKSLSAFQEYVLIGSTDATFRSLASKLKRLV